MVERLKTGVLFVGAGALVYFVGGFSLRGTIVIISLLGLGWLWHTESLAEVRAIYNLSSTPYTVWIGPKISQMLYDLGIVPPEWKPPDFDSESLPERSPVYLLYGGISAVVLQSDSSARLVHWTGRNVYTKTIEFEQRLDFLKLPYPALKGEIENWSPYFFFRPRVDGYEIGIRVAGHWWDDNRDRLEKNGIVKSFDTSDEADAGRTRITLAVLPRNVFYPLDFKTVTRKHRRKLLEEIKNELPLGGWKVEAPWSPWGKRDLGYGEADYACPYADVSLRLLR